MYVVDFFEFGLTFLLQQLYAELDLDDLHNNNSNSGIVLEMKDRDRYFDGRASGVGQESTELVGFIAY